MLYKILTGLNGFVWNISFCQNLYISTTRGHRIKHFNLLCLMTSKKEIYFHIELKQWFTELVTIASNSITDTTLIRIQWICITSTRKIINQVNEEDLQVYLLVLLHACSYVCTFLVNNEILLTVGSKRAVMLAGLDLVTLYAELNGG